MGENKELIKWKRRQVQGENDKYSYKFQVLSIIYLTALKQPYPIFK